MLVCLLRTKWRALANELDLMSIESIICRLKPSLKTSYWSVCVFFLFKYLCRLTRIALIELRLICRRGSKLWCTIYARYLRALLSLTHLMACLLLAFFAGLKGNYKYSRMTVVNNFSSFSMSFFGHILIQRLLNGVKLIVETLRDLARSLCIWTFCQDKKYHQKQRIKGFFVVFWYCLSRFVDRFSSYESKPFCRQLGNIIRIFSSFSWGLFGHVTRLDQLRAS